MTPRSIALMSAIWLGGNPALATPNSGIDFTHFDRNVRIQDDLFSAVNGHWLQTTPIPADQLSYSPFAQLGNLSEERSRKLIKQALKLENKTVNQQKIGDLYRSFMDESTLNLLGIRPLNTDLQRIAALNDLAALVHYFGAHQRARLNLPFTLAATPDARHPSVVLLQLSQSGLGLPNRQYYLQENQQFSFARAAYLSYLKTLFSLACSPDPQARAHRVLALETRLAQAQWDMTDTRDPLKTYNKMTVAALQRLTPGLDWDGFFQGAQLTSLSELNLRQPGYFQHLDTILQTSELEDWRDYLTAHLLNAYAPYLSSPWSQAYFNYHRRALSGAKTPRARWKRAVALVDEGLGNALGKLYVERYFPPAAKQKMDQMVTHLLAAFRQNITTLEWMSPGTQAQALAKLDNYRVKIGYPQVWRDYSELKILPNDLIGNIRNIKDFNYRELQRKLRQPVDRDEWYLSPQAVNAYYHPQLNEIVFSAALLQPPFFDPLADDAVNYGAIGTIIGHEISHGFDDQGSQYDGQGYLHNWWQNDDLQRFRAQAARLVRQYEGYQPLPGHHLNGALTLSENIADNAGLAVAYKAYQLSLEGRPAPVIDGYTGEQRFFIGFAQSRRTKVQDAQILKNLVSSPHAPARFRTNGSVVNFYAFHRAFDVQPGDGMYKPEDQRIGFW